jgi:hypothetical protein
MASVLDRIPQSSLIRLPLSSRSLLAGSCFLKYDMCGYGQILSCRLGVSLLPLPLQLPISHSPVDLPPLSGLFPSVAHLVLPAAEALCAAHLRLQGAGAQAVVVAVINESPFTRIFRLFPQLKLFAPRIRASWALVLKRVPWDVLGRRLYETIFEEAPFLESMFDRSAITMGIKLVDMIDSMVGAPGRPWRG